MKYLLVDSHCHLDRIHLTVETALSEAAKQGVGHFLCVCVAMDTYPKVLEIAEGHKNVFASVGLHPTEGVAQEPSLPELIQLARHPKVVALGETGLDYYRLEGGDPTLQQDRFRTHIRAAKTVSKPLIVHTRQAKEDTLRILQEENAKEIGGVLHCFTEDLDMAMRGIELGFYISFSGIVTFHNAKELKEIVKQIPLEKMLIETDCPYLAPVPFRGKPNQPAYVRYVAEYIAELRQIPYDTVAEQTTKNFFELFKHAANTSM